MSMMKWIFAVVLAVAMAGCAHSPKVADSVPRESGKHVGATDIAIQAAKGFGWSDRLFTTTETTADGWRVFVEEATGRKRKAWVIINKRGEVMSFRQVS
jgi:hypothetical protein